MLSGFAVTVDTDGQGLGMGAAVPEIVAGDRHTSGGNHGNINRESIRIGHRRQVARIFNGVIPVTAANDPGQDIALGGGRGHNH